MTKMGLNVYQTSSGATHRDPIRYHLQTTVSVGYKMANFLENCGTGIIFSQDLPQIFVHA